MHATPEQPTVTEPAILTPARTLRDAADYLHRHGWLQHRYYGDPTNSHPPACTLGALAIASYGYPHPEPFSHPCDEDGQYERWQDFIDAEYVLARFLGLHDQEPDDDGDLEASSLHRWNDQPNRTHTQVIASLRAAADDHDRGGTQ